MKVSGIAGTKIEKKQPIEIIGKPIFPFVYYYNPFLSQLLKSNKNTVFFSPSKKLGKNKMPVELNCPITNKIFFDIFLLMACLSNKPVLISKLLKK